MIFRLISTTAITLALISVGQTAQRAPSPLPAEQTVFSAEQMTVNHPIALPEAALGILRNDPGVLATLRAKKISPSRLAQSWFMASEVHLAGQDEADLVVMGIGPLRGANVVTFWVLGRTRGEYRLLLLTSALSLEVLASKTNDYRDIRTVQVTATRTLSVTFRFRSDKYVPSKTKEEPR